MTDQPRLFDDNDGPTDPRDATAEAADLIAGVLFGPGGPLEPQAPAGDAGRKAGRAPRSRQPKPKPKLKPTE